MSVTPEASQRLWATYQHIAKLDALGEDEQGNTWNQRSWAVPRENATDELQFLPAGEHSCGTARCFAGWYAALSGLKVDQCGDVQRENEMPQHVGNFTESDAGLSPVEGTLLFDGNNSLEKIRARLIEITGEDRS